MAAVFAAATAKLVRCHPPALCLVFALNISNVTVVDYGATWQMWKHDYADLSQYCFSMAWPGLWIESCQGCRVHRLIVTMTGGDGIMVV